MEEVSSFSDVGRTSRGTKVDKRFAHLQRDEKETLRYTISEVLGTDDFHGVSSAEKDAIETMFINLPGANIRNPTISAVAIIFVRGNDDFNSKSINKFQKRFERLKISKQDLVRYIRFIQNFISSQQ